MRLFRNLWNFSGTFFLFFHDDAFFPYWREQLGSHTFLTFGFNPAADISTSLALQGNTQHFVIKTPKGEIEIELPLLGKHNIQNALAATAATLAIGIDLSAIRAGLEKTAPAKGRLQLYQSSTGIQVIDDTYNANPFSLQAAVDSLSTFQGPKIAVLGDMNELGQEAAALHHEFYSMTGW